jgi:IclR family KDG regulon transcriptional repressor
VKGDSSDLIQPYWGEKENVIASVQKMARILNCFTKDRPALGISEIAAELDMNASTVHHLVRTLCQEGILMKDRRKKYRLGWKLLEWSNHVMYQQDIYSEAIPLVEELIRKFNKATVHIGMLDQGDVVFVLKIASKHSVPVGTHIGMRKPAYCFSTGKVLLAYNPSLVQPVIARGLLKRAPNTITKVDSLLEELDEIRTKGFATSINENEFESFGVAAPIRSYTGQTVAALNMVGPIAYMQEHCCSVIKSVIRTADLISKELGYIEL